MSKAWPLTLFITLLSEAKQCNPATRAGGLREGCQANRSFLLGFTKVGNFDLCQMQFFGCDVFFHNG